MMTSSSSNSAHDDVFVDHHHPFPDIQIVTPTTDYDHYDDHEGHYCHNWVSDHHHCQLDQHKHQQVGSDDGLNQSMGDTKEGLIDQANLAWEHNNDILYDPMIESVNINIDNNWVLSSSKLKVVRKINPKRVSTSKPSLVVEISTDESPYFPPPENDSSSINSGTNGNNNNLGIRVCSDCNTTKTPLWRSGPKGPKSLCNACGIRQRKARRALAAAVGVSTSDNNTLTNDTTTSSPKSLKLKTSNTTNENKTSTTRSHEDDDSNQEWQQPYKKRLKMADHYNHHHHHHKFTYTSNSQDSNTTSYKNGERNDDKMMCFEEFMTVSLSKNAAIHRVFQQDEKEAAILLMALSCGLVHN